MKNPTPTSLRVCPEKENTDKLLDKKIPKYSITKIYNVNRGTLSSYINSQILEELTP